MSSKDDPFGDGKTVISRPRPAEPRAATPRPAHIQAPQSQEGTVFDPGFADRPVTGWNEPAIASGSPEARTSGGARPDWRSVAQASRRISYGSDNPLIAASGPLLVLLGQLRRSPPEVEPAVLADHLAQRIDDFELAVTRSDVSDSDARVARYVLCETVDDIVQTLPDIGPAVWMPIGMLSRFFRADAAGSGFFDALNRVLGNPEPHCDLIELMHACLGLGFEGQYRGAENGAAGLDRIRKDVYQVLRYFRPRPPQDLSPQWQPVVLKGRHRRRVIPVWAAAAAGCALVSAAFVEIRDRIVQEGEAVAAEILSLTPSTPATIEHAAFVPVLPRAAQEPAAEASVAPAVEAVASPSETLPPLPASTLPKGDAQLERVRAALAELADAGKLTVGTKGAFIVVEINNQQLFQPGRATLKPEFQALVGPLASALSAERGPVKVVGHTDSDKPGRTSQFKSNYDLSVARAKAVEKLLAAELADKVTLEVEGKGEDEPIADNKTADGKAKNRRVDLLIAREESS